MGYPLKYFLHFDIYIFLLHFCVYIQFLGICKGWGAWNGRETIRQLAHLLSITDAFLIWCQRHRGQLAAEDVFKRTDRFANRSERAVNGVRCPFFGLVLASTCTPT